MLKHKDFVAFILTHGRADNLCTYQALQRAGYTGPIIFVVDNEDSTIDQYYSRFGKESVYVFNKTEKAKEVDTMDLIDDHKAIVFARNACFDIAKELGYTYFLQLDDDYSCFRSRLCVDNKLATIYVTNFDAIVDEVLSFLDASGAYTVALSQTGDFIGGLGSKMYHDRLTRKAMNSFFCRTDKPIKFTGRMNEDVTTYVGEGSRGKLFFTIADVSLDQLQTQSLSGGMSESYSSFGTFTKTMYTIVSCPSSVQVSDMGPSHRRIHHRIDWDVAVPMIISDKFKKS